MIFTRGRMHAHYQNIGYAYSLLYLFCFKEVQVGHRTLTKLRRVRIISIKI